jgi:hypothetical protein
MGREMTWFVGHFKELKHGFTGSFFNVSLGPVGASKDVMLSPHDNNARENIGTMPFGKKGLGHFIQKKCVPLGRCHPFAAAREPIIIKKDGSPHLFKNGKLAGFTNYSAFPKLSRSATRQGEGKRAPPAQAQGNPLGPALAAGNVLWKDRNSPGSELETMGGAAAVAAAGLDSIKDRGDRDARELGRELIRELLLHELPDLDKPDGMQVKKGSDRYEMRLARLEQDRKDLNSTKGINPKLVAELETEIAHCTACLDVLKKATPGERVKSSFWQTNLLDRWAERCPGVDLLERVRTLRDLDKVVAEQSVSGRPEFFFLPQELCWLEMEIALEALLDIRQSPALGADQFVQLVQAIARGWPGVLEDSRSPLPERRANAAAASARSPSSPIRGGCHARSLQARRSMTRSTARSSSAAMKGRWATNMPSCSQPRTSSKNWRTRLRRARSRRTATRERSMRVPPSWRSCSFGRTSSRGGLQR